ncbi:acyltransferase [Flavobacterium suncheonense]|uniref:Transferase n=1 Tax=Flavobacterium suncheonense GH29-5 = DSM 17707 TaxID=1121899 RepID=A0A0A2MP87_9FLAO|nr:acyltransferase [Flavobacterium suncheonense]KGO90085.1 hypothetical protein Q764_03185 [Flavobacterium suncheonense GH29-5 = DSM 17707]
MIGKLYHFILVRMRILKYRLLSDVRITGKPFFIYPTLLKGKGTIVFGDEVRIGVELSPDFYSGYGYIEARTSDSKIVFGNNVRMNNGFSIVSNKSITIGDNVLIGLHFSVADSDFHYLELDKRLAHNPPSSPVSIGNNVFIGNNVTILKGAVIGENSVIGSNSVVTGSIPENVVAAGNPAKVIRNL